MFFVIYLTSNKNVYVLISVTKKQDRNIKMNHLISELPIIVLIIQKCFYEIKI